MAVRVVVTGIGMISAIGRNTDETIDSLLNSRSGIGPIRLLPTVHKDELPAGEIGLTNRELSELAGIPYDEFTTRSTLLGIIAASEAFMRAGLNSATDLAGMGIVSASTVGGMDRTEKHYVEFRKGHPYNHFLNTHECRDSTEQIARHLGIGGFMTTVSTACSSSANAIMTAARLIRHGTIQRALVGGTDPLSLFTLNGFNSLMILDRQPCRPFDRNRSGLNLGEGAAFLVLEADGMTGDRKVLCELSGYSNANDAFHQTASSPEGHGPYLSMKGALEMSGLKPADISYINAHGTGTDNNDLTEGIAIERLFGAMVPPVSSTKPFTGHTLGAAGAVEAVISILALRHQVIFPNLNLREKMDELSFSPVQQNITGSQVRHVMSNSFGFGGNDSTLIFSAR